MAADLYFSGDIEADGPIPGPFSMIAFGLCVAGRYDGKTYVRIEPSSRTFYRELKPVSDDYDPEALSVSGLDRRKLELHGADPATAMSDAAEWVRQEAGNDRPVFVGYPVVFDWLFLHWYFVKFAGESPFGFSGAIDMKTIYRYAAGVTVDRAGRDDLPKSLRPVGKPHTHNALDDAVEQAEIFSNLLEWDPRGR